MEDIINIHLSDSWKGETSIYLSRIDEALQLNRKLGNSIKRNWLRKYCPGPPVSDASSLAIRIAIYANKIFFVTFQSFPEIRTLWSSGQFVFVPLVVRYVYECWGAVHYSKQTLQRLILEENLERELNRVNRLTNGSRSDVQLPFGGHTNEQSINVLTFIQSLSDIDSESDKQYGFLSEACHPNMFQSSYFQMAGPPSSNWENEKFKEHAHKLLEHTVSIIESISSGIQDDLIEILESSEKYVDEKE